MLLRLLRNSSSARGLGSRSARGLGSSSSARGSPFLITHESDKAIGLHRVAHWRRWCALRGTRSWIHAGLPVHPHRLAKAVSCASSSLVPSPSLLPVAGPPVCSRCGSVDRTASVPQLLISRLDPREVIIDTLLDMLRRRTGDRGIRMIRLGLAEVRAPNGAHVAGEGGVEAQQHEGVVCDRQGRRDRLVGIEIRSHVGLIASTPEGVHWASYSEVAQ